MFVITECLLITEFDSSYFFVSFDADKERMSFEWSPEFRMSIVEVIEDGILDLWNRINKNFHTCNLQFELF